MNVNDYTNARTITVEGSRTCTLSDALQAVPAEYEKESGWWLSPNMEDPSATWRIDIQFLSVRMSVDQLIYTFAVRRIS